MLLHPVSRVARAVWAQQAGAEHRAALAAVGLLAVEVPWVRQADVPRRARLAVLRQGSVLC